MAVATAPLPPGSKGRFLTGHLAEFHRDMLGFYTEQMSAHGDCVRFRVGPRWIVLVSDPDLIEEVLVTKAKNFAKRTHVLSLIVPILGNGLLTSDGEFWLRQRRLLQPVFSRQRIASYGGPMVEYSLRMVDRWHDGEPRDVYQDMMRLALEIIAKTLFDADVAGDAPEIGKALEMMMYNFLNRWGSFLPLPSYFPTPGNLRFHRCIRRLDKIIYRIIAERRAAPEQKNDLLSVLLRARDDEGTRMTDRQLRDEAMTLFLAGHETTANALSFTWYLLGRHPEAEARLRDEIRAVVGDRLPTADDAPRLTYTEAVIQESMRLYPPAYAFGRLAKVDTQIGPFRIPKGYTCISSPWVMHRHGKYWPDPEKFRPERWLDGSTDGLHRFVYFPFGGGARQCIGNSFAMMEMALVLATMVPRVRLEVVPDHPFTLRTAVTLKPANGIQVVVRKR